MEVWLFPEVSTKDPMSFSSRADNGQGLILTGEGYDQNLVYNMFITYSNSLF